MMEIDIMGYPEKEKCSGCRYYDEEDNYCAYSSEGWCQYTPINEEKVIV